jgi:hypothetical protein
MWCLAHTILRKKRPECLAISLEWQSWLLSVCLERSLVMSCGDKPEGCSGRSPRRGGTVPALPYTGSSFSCRHMRYTMMDPKMKPVRNMTALKQRYPGTADQKGTHLYCNVIHFALRMFQAVTKILTIAKFLIMYNLRFSRRRLWRITSSGMLRHVSLVRTDVSEERIAYIIRVTRIGELGTTLAVISNRSTLRRNSGYTFLRNVSSYKSHMAWHPRRRHSSHSPPWKRQVIQSSRFVFGLPVAFVPSL